MAVVPLRKLNTKVNPQVTDATTQTSAQVLGDAPALAMASLYQMAAQSAGQLLQNNASSQHAMNQLNVAVVSTSVANLMSLVTASDSKAQGGKKEG